MPSVANINDQVISLMEERDALVQSAEDVINQATTEARSLTDIEQAEIDGYTAKADDIGSRIEKLQKEQARIDRVAEMRGRINTPAGRKAVPNSPYAREEADAEIVRADEVNVTNGFRCRRPVAFADNAAGMRSAYDAGLYYAAVLGNKRCQRLAEQRGVITRAHSLTAADGGYLTPAPVQAAVIKLVDMYGVARKLCQVVPMSADTLDFPKMSTGMTAYWKAEAAALTESSAQFTSVTLTAKKLTAYTLMSTEVSEDALIDMADWVTEEAARQIQYAEDFAFLYGDGTATYGSIDGIAALFETAEAGTPLAGAYTPSGAGGTKDVFTELAISDFATLVARCPAWAKQFGNAKWLMSTTYRDYAQAYYATSLGGAAQVDMTNPIPERLFGFPVVTTEILPSDLTSDETDDVFLLFGDFRQCCLFGDRRRMTMARSEHVKFAEDQIALKITERVQIQNHGIGTTSVSGGVVAMIGN